MRRSMEIDSYQNSKRVNWATQIKRMLDKTGFGYLWEQQKVNHSEQFIAKFRIRCQDLYIQECFSQMKKSSRCRLFCNVKEAFEMEWYLSENLTMNLDNVFQRFDQAATSSSLKKGDRWNQLLNWMMEYALCAMQKKLRMSIMCWWFAPRI